MSLPTITRDRLLCLVALVFTTMAYAPITRTYFFADDFVHLYVLATRGIFAFLIEPYGGNLYLARNAVFALSYHLFGTSVALYFWTVLLFHLLNVTLLFRVLRRWTNSAALACFGGTMWGIVPSHVGSLNWYSAFGHVMTATALLVLLLDATRRADTGRPPRARVFLSWGLVAFVAANSYGVGFGVALAAPVVLWLVCGPSRPTVRWAAAIVLFPIALGAIYAGMMAFSEWYLDEKLASGIGQLRWFGRDVRAMMPRIVTGFVDLLQHGSTDLLLGFARRPGGHPAPALGWTVAGGLLCLAILALLAGPRAPRRRMLAALVLLTASYGILVVGRVIPARAFGIRDLGGVDRYHYVPTIALVLIVCLGLHRLGMHLPRAPRVHAALLALWLVVSATAFGSSRWRIRHHDAEREHVRDALAILDEEFRVQTGPVVEIENRDVGLTPLLVRFRQTERCPGLACVFAIFYPSNVVHGRRVRFLERNLKTVAAARRYPRSRELIVPIRREPS